MGTASESDGIRTRIRLARGVTCPDVDGLRLVYDGSVEIGRASFTVSNVHDEEYLAVVVATPAPAVRIWIDHDVEPTNVVIAVGG